jgi:hypothetical protein
LFFVIFKVISKSIVFDSKLGKSTYTIIYKRTRNVARITIQSLEF